MATFYNHDNDSDARERAHRKDKVSSPLITEFPPHRGRKGVSSEDNSVAAYPDHHGRQPLIGWGIAWATPALSIACILASLGIMLGHHFYYKSLESTTVMSTSQQQWAIRIGTGLATLNKIVLLTLLGMVATQRIWMTARSKFVTIEGLDCMFRIINEPSALLSLEVWKKGKLLLVLAFVCWLLPLAVVVTPATLYVQPIQSIDTITDQVPIVNMSDPTNWYLAAGVGRITDASIALRRLFSAMYSSNSFLPIEAPRPNATYDLSFWGPSYRCQNLSEVEALPATWNTASITSNYSTYGAAWNGLIRKPVTNRTGAEIIYKSVAPMFMDSTIFVWSEGRNDEWDKNPAVKNTSLVCQLYNTSYDISLEFDNGIQTIIPTSVKTTHAFNFTESEGAFNVVKGYTNVAASYVTQILFSKYFLVGELTRGAAGDILGNLPMMQSKLAYCPEVWDGLIADEITEDSEAARTNTCPQKTLAAAIEDLSRNFTYSVMASGYNLKSYSTEVPLTVVTHRNVYAYNERTLLAVYVACFGVALTWLIIGAVTVYMNGYVSSSSFSTIMVSTRNKDLDQLAAGYYLGAEWLPREVGNQKVMFGNLGEKGPYVHAGFGLEGTVSLLKKGQ
ncbi:unnamed protein product [Clonostachys rosea f. rosea IK726]|uniref:Formylmethionine deformylase-like protein n=2 Tax=Bionectria ochroleuca TaxID=29856 RepID=A0A0B7K968_BIOOC|nr:unnamed protein product [Clonostachys rosea f. rosea IK726]